LVTVADGCDCAEFLGLVFEFKSQCGQAFASNNNTTGMVVMTTQYDLFNGPFTSKQSMEAYEFSCSNKPSESFMHPVECKPSANVLGPCYIRSTAVPSGANIQFYDRGVFSIATQGMQTTATVGELWVTYHVRMTKPRISSSIGGSLLYGRMWTVGTSITGSYWATSYFTSNYNTIGMSASVNDMYVYTYILGAQFLAVFMCAAGTSVSNGATMTLTSGASAITCLPTSASGVGSSTFAAGSGTAAVSSARCYVTTLNSTNLSMSSPTIVGTASCELIIIQVNSAVTLDEEKARDIFHRARMSLVDDGTSDAHAHCADELDPEFEDDCKSVRSRSQPVRGFGAIGRKAIR